MSSPTSRNTSARRSNSSWDIQFTPIIVLVLIVALLGWGGCALLSDDDDARGGFTTSFDISYAGAAGRLAGLAPREAEEQLRDWARFGLAAHLKMDTARFRDASYDTLPVRDPYFADLAEQPTGPGRALYDGAGVLHVLVPHDDRRAARTIGLLIDEHRTDSGSDPRSVRVHRYRIVPATRTIQFDSGKAEPTATARSAHGFVTARVDTPEGLKGFLAKTRHLSWLETRGRELWAGGWNWKDDAAVPLDMEDVAAIQRGYQSMIDRAPGFSLDPGDLRTAADLRAALPQVDARIADAVASGNWSGTPFRAAGELVDKINGVLFREETAAGLPSDRTQLWSLLQRLQGQHSYSKARYEGGLKGTKVGMTLFYTDYVAKNWVAGTREGVPSKAVAGFLSDPEAPVSWSHCQDPKNARPESGRLWFGQNASGFAFEGERVSIGARATRLFSKSNNPAGGEQEPSHAFGRGLRWWDRHYQDVADYEPQYARLDQIMRWSGALDWLTAKSGAPQLPRVPIKSDLRFQDWYAQQRGELRENSSIAFVQPPSAEGAEGVLSIPSKPYEYCGLHRIVGGVTLADLVHRGGASGAPPNVPPELRRAGPLDESSAFDRSTGQGHLKERTLSGGQSQIGGLERDLSPGPGGSAVVRTKAEGQRDASLGGAKVERPETAERQVETEISAGQGKVTQRAEVEGADQGAMTAQASPRTVTLQWRPGVLDRARRAMESIRRRMAAGLGATPAPDSVLYGAKDDNGRDLYKIGETEWISITEGVVPPGDHLAFRLGAPGPGDGAPRFVTAEVVPSGGTRGKKEKEGDAHPGRGPPGSWTTITPATPDRPARAVPAPPPGRDGRPIRVETPGGESTTVYASSAGLHVPSDNPVVGRDGSVEGAAFARDFPRVEKAMNEAAQTRDRLFRAIALGPDGVALAGADKVILVPNDHSFAGRVLRALGDDLTKLIPLIRLDNGHAYHVSRNKLKVSPDAERQEKQLHEMTGEGDKDVYVHEKLRSRAFADGPVVHDPMPHDVNVIVVEVEIVPGPEAESPAAAPDVYVHDGSNWLLMRTGTAGRAAQPRTTSPSPTPSGGTHPGPTPSPPVSAGAPWPGARPGQHVLLVCPADDKDVTTCEDD